MIGVVDPALLLPRSGPAAERQLAAEIGEVLRACREHEITVPRFEYWDHLWGTLGVRLQRQLSTRDARRAVEELRKVGSVIHDRPHTGEVRGRVWGFDEMFGPQVLGVGWRGRMERAVVSALMMDRRAVLLVRRMVGRNVREHGRLREVTRWIVQLHISGMGPTAVLCVHHTRNLDLRWTSRIDWRLPAERDGARYPFCPPARWWTGDVAAVATVESKPAWIDRRRNGWARPSIGEGRGHHWDVFLADHRLRERIGLAQLNIVEFPGASGKLPGSIDHVPAKKRGRLRADPGWRC